MGSLGATKKTIVGDLYCERTSGSKMPTFHNSCDPFNQQEKAAIINPNNRWVSRWSKLDRLKCQSDLQTSLVTDEMTPEKDCTDEMTPEKDTSSEQMRCLIVSHRLVLNLVPLSKC